MKHENNNNRQILLYLTLGQGFDSVRCLHNVISYGYLNRSSDIHLDIMDNFGVIKLRINGHLIYYAICDLTLFQGLLGVIKSRSNLRIDLHDRGQDGAFIFYPYRRRPDRRISVRVSISPTLHGESVVMRLLDQGSNSTDSISGFESKISSINAFAQLGMGADLVNSIEKYTKLENSLILISGATGSGKTTTMYSIIRNLDPTKNVIISLEDPVEKNIPDVRQIPVKPHADFSYAEALKTALRQDPDVIVIGEIRDRETALITIEAALTGHLVIAGIHARDPVDVLMRLTQLDVDYFLISQVLSLSIHQRMIYDADMSLGAKVDFRHVDFFSFFERNFGIANDCGERLTPAQIKSMKSEIQ